MKTWPVTLFNKNKRLFPANGSPHVIQFLLDVLEVLLKLVGNRSVYALFFGTVVNLPLNIVSGVFELPHSFAKAFRNARNFIRAKDHYHDKHDKEYFCPAYK